MFARVLTSSAAGDFPVRSYEARRGRSRAPAARHDCRLASWHDSLPCRSKTWSQPCKRAPLDPALPTGGLSGPVVPASDGASSQVARRLAEQTSRHLAERRRSLWLPVRLVDHPAGGRGGPAFDRRALPSRSRLPAATPPRVFLAATRAPSTRARRAESAPVAANRLASNKKSASRSVERSLPSTNPVSP